MSVITVSREFGSEGDYIARQIAGGLRYHLVDQAFIGTVLDEYGLVEFGKEYQSLPGFWEKFNAEREKRRDLMVDMLNRVLLAVARHGNVVVLGRSGFAVLEGYADVLHVRVQAPFAVRVARVMMQQQLEADQAQALVKESDKVRMAFVEDFYRVPWGTAQAFDLVIDTGKITPDLAAAWVVDAARSFQASLDPDKPSTRLIEVDSTLAHAVTSKLNCHVDHHWQPVRP